jgi:hypothetical protein
MNSTQHAISVLSASLANTVQKALAAQRNYSETLTEQSVRNGTAAGFVELDGEGESTVAITFPIRFIEKPIFTVGLELADNVWLSFGNFPIWSATIGGWTTAPADNEPLIVGALIGIYVSGAARSILHYQFQGRSLTNPSGGQISVGSIL